MSLVSAAPPVRANGVPRELVPWLSARDRVMIVAPHPDDESLATGGLIQHAIHAGAALRVLYMTDGDDNPWAQLVCEGRWPRSAADRARWGVRRQREALAALARLGLPAHMARFIGLPDQGLTALLLGADPRPVEALAAELQEWRPSILVAPSTHDHHPDHSATAVLAKWAQLESSRVPGLVLSYSVHSRRSGERGDPSWNLPLGPAQRDLKRRAILCHRTQLRWRRFQLPAFARPIERFEGPATRELPDRASVGMALVSERALHVMIERFKRPRLGAAILRVVLAQPGGRRTAISLMLPDRSSGAEGLEGTNGDVRRPTRVRVTPNEWRVALPLELTPVAGFVKVEWPLEQRLGMLDHEGWRSVLVPSQEPADGGGAFTSLGPTRQGLAGARAPA